MREYDQIATWYSSVRNPDVGRADLETLAASLAPGARILDLGCGDGVPVTQFFLDKGFEVVGLDSSSAMLATYRARFPAVPTRQQRIQDAHFADQSFDAVVAWGVLFHLSETEQEDAIPKVAGWLKLDGLFLFTSGATEGVTESKMNGVTFRYTSLGRDAYRRVIEQSGMRLEDEYADAWDNHVYLARKADP